VLRIQGRRIVGYALRVVGLTDEDSVRLQEEGLGGRRRMGCGVLVPFTSVCSRIVKGSALKGDHL
jgi:CRISPR-associated protein Cas6